MKSKAPNILVVIVFCVMLFVVPAFPTHAFTGDDIKLLISKGVIPAENIIVAKQAFDLKQANQGSLANSEGFYFNTGGDIQAIKTTEQTTTQQTTSTQSCTQFSTDLVVGMSGAAVTKLQQFLKSKGHFTYPEITGYYGNVTREAVQSFQAAENIVVSGTPETTGFGIVGPRTRETINELTCLDGVGTTGNGTVDEYGNVLGYDLNELFDSYDADFAYDAGDGGGFSFDYDADFAFDPGDGFDSNFDYDAALDFDAGFEYDSGNDFTSDFNYFQSGGELAGDPIVARIGAQDSSGEYFWGEGRRVYPESKSRTVNVKWESRNADGCVLSGNFYEGRVAVPEDGDADVYLTNPSAWLTQEEMLENVQTDIEAFERRISGETQQPAGSDFDWGSDFNFDTDFGYGSDDGAERRPVFAISIECSEEQRFGNSYRDTVYVHLDPEAVEQEEIANTPAPRISGITPTSGRFGREIFVLGTNFSQEGNTVTIRKSNKTGMVRTLTDIYPATNGSLRFTFPSETERFRNANGNTIKGESGNYTITITSNATQKVSNAVTYKVN